MDTGGDFRPVRFMIWDHLFFWVVQGKMKPFSLLGGSARSKKITQLEGPPKEICSFGVPHLGSISCGSD